MNREKEPKNQQLEKKVLEMETQIKHLRNELQLAEQEKESARKNYFDIMSHMEEKVNLRTRETKELRQLTEAKGKELQIMLDSSPAMIFYKDTEQRYIRVNKTFSRTLGVPINKIVGKTLEELIPGNVAAFLDNDLEVLKKGEPMLNSPGLIDTPKGRRQVITNKVPYKDINGKIIGLIGFALDVTELRQAEEEKLELEEKLLQLEKMEAIGRLAGGVAHDLNNVLSAVVSYPDLLLLKLPVKSPLRRPLMTIQKSGKKAAAIVEDLLTLARRSVTITEVVNLNNIVNAYTDSAVYEKLKSFNPRVKVETRLAKDLFNIKGSPIHLTKTVMNLMSNAVEATSRKGRVTISTENRYLDKPVKSFDLGIPEGDYVVLTVVDTGIGIKSDNVNKIFEPFYTKKVMGRSGTGLGMAVVWGTVKDHRGNINISSVENEGTTFELFFPITREKIEDEKRSIPVDEYTGNNEKILVVDDVQEQREISCMMLSSLQYIVHTVASGEEAVEFMRTHHADLVVMDMIMDPGIDGLETYKQILEIHPGQKAIITSGFSETDHVYEAQMLGAGAYIKKP
ncbi:MAG: PAS domain-containing protein, partial [bacterium]|nr:PAS domain-containing protein [bacterium]